MRLIDADALLETLKLVRWAKENESKYTGDRNITVTWKDAIITVKNAPTIEPENDCKKCVFKPFKQFQPERKRGKWIKHPEQKNIYGGKCVECSECGEKYVVQYIEDEKYCRNCGAEMRGEE